jgi:hypothetical protein
VSKILSLQRFTEICRKVYFAVEAYSDIDYLLANGFLYLVMSQYEVNFAGPDLAKHRQTCWNNFEDAVMRLPLLMNPSTDVIAALVLAVGCRRPFIERPGTNGPPCL